MAGFVSLLIHSKSFSYWYEKKYSIKIIALTEIYIDFF